MRITAPWCSPAGLDHPQAPVPPEEDRRGGDRDLPPDRHRARVGVRLRSPDHLCGAAGVGAAGGG